MSTRNVVLLGEVGSGKSSIINLIAGRHVAEPSNEAKGGTLDITCYTLSFSRSNVQVNLWDTPGWHPAEEKDVKQRQAVGEVDSLLQTLHATEGIHLLIFCMQAGRAPRSFLKMYNSIYLERAWCKTPVALVVTWLELMQPDMHTWWENNWRSLEKQKLYFHSHACVTTVDDSRDGKQVSQNRLRKLILHHVPTDSLSHVAFCPSPEDGVQLFVTGVREVLWSAPICFPTLAQRTQNDVLIIVTGPLGSGKSSFISKVTGIPEDSVGVGHSLNPSTLCVRDFCHVDQQSGKRVIFLDVPGFSHPLQSGKILRMIASWLKDTYSGDAPVGGILYLHSVAHSSVVVPPEEFLALGGKCGKGMMSKLSLVTTMWDEVLQTDGAVELAKCEQAWQPVLRPGENVSRYLNTYQSAREIIRPFLS